MTCNLTIGSSDRGSTIFVEPRRGSSDWDKADSFVVGATPRRSTSSLDSTCAPPCCFSFLFTGNVVGCAHAQSKIVIRLTAHQTCQIVDKEVACADVGAKLRAIHAKQDSDIHIIAGPTSSYQLVSATLTSLKEAGYRIKVGYVATGSD